MTPLTEILSGADRVMAPGAGAVEKDTGGADGGGAVATGGSPVGVRLVPSWSPGMEEGVEPERAGRVSVPRAAGAGKGSRS
ncbi:MAG: hypothetical protein JWO67_3292 [Streptosporangiaceae bacterium]|nr:hypothetical protein [Streptosporangiaceae bacterium]